MSDDTYVQVMHKECGQVAFILNRRPRATDVVSADDIVWPAGVSDGDPMICGGCKRGVNITELRVVGGLAP